MNTTLPDANPLDGLFEPVLPPALDPFVDVALAPTECQEEAGTGPLENIIELVEAEISTNKLRGDSLADSVAILLVMAVVQRVAGFARGLMFCRWLEPDQLGQWDMALGFLVLAAPLIVLGLPGSFGRYLEYYRQRGQLRTILRRTTLACVGLTLCGSVAVGLLAARFSNVVFGSAEQTVLMGLVALTLGAVIAYNFLVELLTALRRFRLVSWVQFFNSLAFAILSLVGLHFWQTSAAAIVIAYGIACLLSCLGAIPWLCSAWKALPAVEQPLSHRALWSKLLPFAAWMWVTNLLFNLFDVADRYMLLHNGSISPDDALAQVGHYHSSRVVPLLMVTVAAMLASMILPHLSHDWEAGRRKEVSDRLNLVLKLLGLALMAGSVVLLWLAPLLFNIAFEGKYAGGLAVLPWTLTYCAWLGMGAVAQSYLWCAEKAWLGCLAMLVGLVVNVALNLVLLPLYGLHGAVIATTAANFVAILLIFAFNRARGMRIALGTWLIALLPASLGLGVWAASGALLIVAAAALFGTRILSSAEKSQLGETLEGYWRRIRGRRLAEAT